ncbi:MAG TPA: hypothetical protein VHN79_00950, partial [Lacunisphaera sp.]|nr:hypothetical protein [Lacunisphaera sp.]
NDNLNHNPTTQTDYAWWVPAPIRWAWSSNTFYTTDHDIVNYQGDWWLCTNTHTSSSTFNWSNWTWIPAPSLAWKNFTWYALGAFVYRTSNNTWYRCTSGHVSNWSFDSSKFTRASWEFQNARTYSFDALVNQGGSWYRYINSNPASGVAPDSNPAYWENALSGSSHGWNSSSITYNLGDTVYHDGQWYRCIRAHASSGSITPASTAYWTNSPLLSPAWDSGKQYSQNDAVTHNGVWHLSLQNNNVGQNPSTATNRWIGADTTNPSYTWNASTNYSTGAYRCYGGVWYRCIASHLNKSPNDASYWTAVGPAVVYSEAIVSISNSPPLRTQLRAPLAPAPLFPNAAAATTTLTVTTGTGTVDSYDSSAGPYGGSNMGYSAVLAAQETLSINGTTAVKGYLAAPTLPSNISTGTTVKGLGSPASNVDPTRLSRSPHVPQFGTLPSNGLTAAFSSGTFHRGTRLATNPSGTVTIGTPGATTPSRYYVNGDLQIGPSPAHDMAVLNICGPVILQVNGNLRIESGGIIDMTSTGSAEIHYKLIFRAYSGSAGIRNRSEDPKKLVLITDSSSSQLTFFENGNSSTNRNFYGIVYAPNITTSSGLEIRSGINVYGAISASKITFSSEANLHYDTSLRHATIPGVDQPYAVVEWRELPGSELATMP